MSLTEQEKAKKTDHLTIANYRFEEFFGLTVEESEDFNKLTEEILNKYLAINNEMLRMDTNNPLIKDMVSSFKDAINQEKIEFTEHMKNREYKDAYLKAQIFLALLNMIMSGAVANMIDTLTTAQAIKTLSDKEEKEHY